MQAFRAALSAGTKEAFQESHEAFLSIGLYFHSRRGVDIGIGKGRMVIHYELENTVLRQLISQETIPLK